MGRLSKTNLPTPNIKVHYKKLVDDYTGSCDALKIMPSLPEYLSYCCHHCGHTQKLQVIPVTFANALLHTDAPA